MLSQLLQVFGKNTKQSLAQRSSPSSAARPRVEELEARDTPNAASAFVPAQHLVTNIIHDVREFRSDLQQVSHELRNQASAAITSDINAINAGLSAVISDLSAGTSATADLNNLATAEAKLAVDLNAGNLGHHFNGFIRHELGELREDLADLRQDLGQITQTVQSVVTHVRSDLQALTNALNGVTLSANASADVNALNTSLSAVFADLAAGRIATSDLNAAIAAEINLSVDLGGSITPAIRTALQNLQNDVQSLSQNLSMINRLVNQSLTNLQSDVQRLAMLEGASASATVTADIRALNNALTVVLNESAAGQINPADLAALTTALNTLTTDLGTNASSDVQHIVSDLSNQLMALNIELAASRVV